jgi:hypothetical protein
MLFPFLFIVLCRAQRKIFLMGVILKQLHFSNWILFYLKLISFGEEGLKNSESLKDCQSFKCHHLSHGK